MALSQRYIQEQPQPASDEVVENYRFTEEEYFAFEEQMPYRWEFVPTPAGSDIGVIRAICVNSPNHATIAVNLCASVKMGLHSIGNHSCFVFGCALKIRTGDGLNTYPDVTVAPENLTYYDERNDVITNPLLVAEVLAPLTEKYDRDVKSFSFETIPSLKHYILVYSTRPRIEVYTRKNDDWRAEAFEGRDTKIKLSTLGISLYMEDIYEQVQFAQP